MTGKIRTLMFGKEHECQSTADVLKALQSPSGSAHEHYHVADLEEYERALAEWDPTLLIVLAEGAEGMECVYRSRERRPLLPVFWFSDDREFGMQSYRLNCAYFSTKPVSHEKLTRAFQRCRHLGIRYEMI